MLKKFKQNVKEILNFKSDKVSGTFVLLAVLNVAVLLVSNIIANRLFQVLPLTEALSIVLPCAVIVYPCVFVSSDLISEIYGYVWSRRVCYLSFLCNVLMVGLFHVTNLIGQFGSDLSNLNGTWYVLIASFISFLVGSLINDIVLKRMKVRDGEKNKAMRFVVSSIWGQLLDASIFLILGMWLFPTIAGGYVAMSWVAGQLPLCILTQVIVKVAYELILSPFMAKWADKVKAREAAAGFTYGE